jgi:hypothetical protein
VKDSKSLRQTYRMLVLLFVIQVKQLLLVRRHDGEEKFPGMVPESLPQEWQ